MSAPRRATRTNLFGLGRPTRRRSRGPTRRELAGQLANARRRADRAIERLERARTEYELEEALRLGKHALRHLEATERKAVAGGVDEPGGGLLGVFGRGGSRPASGLARLIEQVDDRLAARREYERRGRRRALDRASGAGAATPAARPGAGGGRHEAKTREFSPIPDSEWQKLEKRERTRRKERAKKDENAALRQLHTGRKAPRQAMSAEEQWDELGSEANPARQRARRTRARR